MALPSLGSDPFLGPSNYPLKIKQLQYTAKNRFQSRIAQILLKNQQITCASPAVFCRIGSLEMNELHVVRLIPSFLPHRQLRKARAAARCRCPSFLPHRQLRKGAHGRRAICRSFLPHRQLRKFPIAAPAACPGFLPHRQLRKQSRCRCEKVPGFLPHRQLRKRYL